jgi:hypothetical protein
MLAVVEFADVFADVGAADTGVALDLSGLARPTQNAVFGLRVAKYGIWRGGVGLGLEGRGVYVEVFTEGEDDGLDLSCQFSGR